MNENVQPQLDLGALVGGRFRVVKLLGEGGAAVVYEVRDERSGRRLALKRLQSSKLGSNTAASSALFEREYHTLRQLAHPRIVAVFDYGVEAARDRELFTRQVRLCAKEYRCGSGSSLNAKLARLLHEAGERGLSAPAELLQSPA